MTDKFSGQSAIYNAPDPDILFDPDRLDEAIAYAREHYPEAAVLEICFAGTRLIAIKIVDGTIVSSDEEAPLT